MVAVPVHLPLIFLVQLLALAAAVSAASLFVFLNDNRCLRDSNSTQLLETSRLINERQCAMSCYKVGGCAAFMTVASNRTCQLFGGCDRAQYTLQTYVASGECRIGVLAGSNCDPSGTSTTTSTQASSTSRSSTSTSTQTSSTSSSTSSTSKSSSTSSTSKSSSTSTTSLSAAVFVFNSSTTWVVPSNFSVILGVCIGGGGGGVSEGSFGGAGSGYVEYELLSAAAGTSIAITIGSGGSPGASGQTSSIGSYLSASGGAPSNSFGGGSGGSGGGGGTNYWSGYTGSGGSGGSNGGAGYGSAAAAGSGQGTSLWSDVLEFNEYASLELTAGPGGAGYNNSSTNIGAGGGGGGGILVNGYGPTAGSGTTSAGGKGGVGYGAGGGGSGCYVTCSYIGGSGAPGLCIILVF